MQIGSIPNNGYRFGQYDIHVVPYGDGQWAIKDERYDDYSGYPYDTKREAMSDAIECARRGQTMLVVHGMNGRIQEVRNYRFG